MSSLDAARMDSGGDAWSPEVDAAEDADGEVSDARGEGEVQVAPGPDDTAFVGFGARARGGLVEGARERVVRSGADAGEGTLREALSGVDGPTRITFAQDLEIELSSYVDVPSRVAIDARGREVTLTGCGLRLMASRDVVLMNLRFVNIGRSVCGDAIQMRDGSRDVVVTHATFDNGGMEFVPDIPDEQISVVSGSTDITIAWSTFRNHDKVLLVGNGDFGAEVDGDIRVTLHHNVFDSTGRRHPFLRYGKVDMFNNLLRDWTRYLETPYGARVQQGGELLLEGNVFEQSDPSYRLAAVALDGGKLRAEGNVHAADVAVAERASSEVFARPYEVKLDEPGPRLVEMLTRHAGATWD